ncbi:MAG TPA: methyltransferase domain-containing protein [Gemmatimonadaceae bacterium]
MAARSFFDLSIATSLRCPVCRGMLQRRENALLCTRETCGRSFPVVRDVPVLINEDRSVFTISEIAGNRGVEGRVVENVTPPSAGLKQRLIASLPDVSRNRKADENFAALREELIRLTPNPRVLVVGGGVLGFGMEEIASDPRIELTESDVFFGSRTNLICDATDLPFADQSFDGVVIQGVIGNVADPYRAMEEIHRVLRPRGLLYVEAPFVQQVCLGPYDFTRFSLLGLRRLCRSFEEVRSGAQCGPGMSAAWAYQYLLLSFTRTQRARAWTRLIARLTGSWLLWFDRFLMERPAALDAASGVFFLGRRAETPISDRELIGLYRGGYS